MRKGVFLVIILSLRLLQLGEKEKLAVHFKYFVSSSVIAFWDEPLPTCWAFQVMKISAVLLIDEVEFG